MRPGVKLIDICNRIEETNLRLVEKNGLMAGIGFPTGCSINSCAAHYTPNPGDETVLNYDDGAPANKSSAAKKRGVRSKSPGPPKVVPMCNDCGTVKLTGEKFKQSGICAQCTKKKK